MTLPKDETREERRIQTGANEPPEIIDGEVQERPTSPERAVANWSDGRNAITPSDYYVSPMEMVERILEQQAAIDALIDRGFTEGLHFGKPFPGAKENTLLIPGAELFTAMFRVRPEFECLSKEDDLREGVFAYEYKCRLVNPFTGAIVGEAIGSCTSKEEKYAFHNGERVCPDCGQAAISKGAAQYGGGWYCSKKKGGCNAKFADNDSRITDQQVGKVPNPNIFDVRNTVNKMAQNRAFKKAVCTMGALSGRFSAAADEDDVEPGEGQKKSNGRKSNGKSPALTPVEWDGLINFAADLIPATVTYKRTDLSFALLKALNLSSKNDPYNGTLDEAKAAIKAAIEAKYPPVAPDGNQTTEPPQNVPASELERLAEETATVLNQVPADDPATTEQNIEEMLAAVEATKEQINEIVAECAHKHQQPVATVRQGLAKILKCSSLALWTGPFSEIKEAVDIYQPEAK